MSATARKSCSSPTASRMDLTLTLPPAAPVFLGAILWQQGALPRRRCQRFWSPTPRTRPKTQFWACRCQGPSQDPGKVLPFDSYRRFNMSTAVVSQGSQPSRCPVSGSTTSTSACPFSSPAVSKRPRKRTSSRAPTDIPDLRRTPSSELLYLPPLLSLLPTQSRDAEPITPFSFDQPAVGFTKSRLPSIDEASIALHHALKHFRPTTENYAYGAYEDAFNWEELVLPEEVEREW